MLNRRQFLQNLGGTAAVASGTLALTGLSHGKSGKTPDAHVVVVGGGFGGATCAKYLAKLHPQLKITLIDSQSHHVTCPFSNTVIGGLNKIDYITHSFDQLKQRWKINVVQDRAVDVDPVAKTISLQAGKKISYDKLVLSPGIDFKWEAIEGYDKAVAEQLPHAWQAGPQTILLRKQLEAMADGGTVIITAPGNPFRCPPGPYERASLMAWYFKSHKPKSKILILDDKDKFSKQPLFQDAWDELYGNMIEWVPGSQGGKIKAVNAKNKTVTAVDGEVHKGAVINIIPPQKAGAIAVKAGLSNDAGWCKVNQRTFESAVHKHIYVIGDASIAGKMPKSGYAANNQAKVCAMQLIADLMGKDEIEPSWANTCYSLVSKDYGISVAAVYRHTKDGIKPVKGAGGVSPRQGNGNIRTMEAVYADGWYRAITRDMFS